MSEAKQLHRIYQGRVSVVEGLSASDQRKKAGKTPSGIPLSRRAGEDVLWSAHETFQTAVNWYLMGLASMVTDEHPALGSLRRQLRECWDGYQRRQIQRTGLRGSFARWLGMTPAEATFEAVERRMLGDNPASAVVRALAVDLLIEKACGGDGAIQQGGPTYLPRWCVADYKGKWDCDIQATTNSAGEEKIAAFLHADSAADESAIRAMSQQFSIGWLVALDARFFEPEEGRERIASAITHFRQHPEPNGRIAMWLKSRSDATAELGNLTVLLKNMPQDGCRIPRNRKAALDRSNAAILFKLFPSAFTRDLLRLMVAKPKPNTKKSAAVPEEANAVNFARAGDDPIKLARCSRGFIFPSFTSLSLWGGTDGDPQWKDFDIAAFKEALKTINQLKQRGDERRDKRARVEAGLAWMNGEIANRKDAQKKLKEKGAGDDDEDPDLPGVLAGDPRTNILDDVLKKDLAISNDLTDNEAIAYALRGRTLRGYRELTEQWNKHLDKHPDADAAALIRICVEHQTKHRDDAGGVAFFRALTRRECWPIWRTPTDHERSERERNNWSEDLVRDYAKKLEWEEDLRHYQQDIRFTPADAEHSPRLLMLSDLGGDHEYAGSTAIVPIPRLVDGKWQKSLVRLRFTAPRLRRDGLAGAQSTHWLPPVAAALGLTTPPTQDFSTTALALMPRRRGNRIACLVNLPVQIETDAMQKAIRALGGAQLTPEQCAGTKEKHIHLHWPGTEGKKADWWSQLVGFRVLSVDLGQRVAGACALLSVQSGDPAKSHAWALGSTGKRSWHARLEATGLLRLPGENAIEGTSGKRERSGARGRKASEVEIADCRRLLDILGESALADEPTFAGRTFPEQNDLLLIAARRAQSRLYRLHRWLWMLSEEDRTEKALEELRQDDAWKADADSPHLSLRLRAALDQALTIIPEALLAITERILPQRRTAWAWVATGNRCHCLQRMPAQRPGVKRRGQRGLSMFRIEQIEELRKRWQSLNKSMQRTPGAKAVSRRDEALPDPCPDLLDKLERMKDDRIDQLAHLILAQALGVRLRAHAMTDSERQPRDQHGEYERFRAPVDAVVLEDLARYLSSQDRSPRENSRLMKWCHRAVLLKVKMLCEPYGIPVVEVNAAYSSRFCSRTGVAGFRAVEITAADKDDWLWKKLLTEANGEKPSAEANHAKELFAWLAQHPSPAGKPPRTLLAPRGGGPLFVPMRDWPGDKPGVQQADINAAVNLGLRAVAGPTAFAVRPVMRVEPDAGNGMKVVCVNKLEKARGKAALPALGEERKAGKWFVDHGSIVPATWDVKKQQVPISATVTIAGTTLRVATSKALWGTVKANAWTRAMAINRKRVHQWQRKEQEKQAPF